MAAAISAADRSLTLVILFSPIEYEKPTALGRVVGLASRAPCRLASHRVDKVALLFRIIQETGEAIGLFRRTSLAGQASVSTI
jgi:hypothetical protein